MEGEGNDKNVLNNKLPFYSLVHFTVIYSVNRDTEASPAFGPRFWSPSQKGTKLKLRSYLVSFLKSCIFYFWNFCYVLETGTGLMYDLN